MCPPRETQLQHVVKASQRETFSLALVSLHAPYEIAFAWTHLIETRYDSLSPRSKIFGYFARLLAVATTVRVFPRTSVVATSGLAAFDGMVRVVSIMQAWTNFQIDLPASVVRAVILDVPAAAHTTKSLRARLIVAQERVSRACAESNVMFAAFDVERDLASLDAFFNQVVFQCRVRRQDELHKMLAAPSPQLPAARTATAAYVAAALAAVVAVTAALIAVWK